MMPKREADGEQKKPFVPTRTNAELLAMPNVKVILEEQGPAHRKNYKLHLVGLTSKEISNVTGSSISNVMRDVGGYTRVRKSNGEFVYKLPYEQ